MTTAVPSNPHQSNIEFSPAVTPTFNTQPVLLVSTLNSTYIVEPLSDGSALLTCLSGTFADRLESTLATWFSTRSIEGEYGISLLHFIEQITAGDLLEASCDAHSLLVGKELLCYDVQSWDNEPVLHTTKVIFASWCLTPSIS